MWKRLPYPLLLASASPRRRELLELVGLPFKVVPPPPEAEPPCHLGAGLGALEALEALQPLAQGTRELSESELRLGVGKPVYAQAGPGSNLTLRLYEPGEAPFLAQVVQAVQDSAQAKAQGVVSLWKGEEVLVLGADTVVVCGRTVLGKPHSAEEARRMLRALSGRWHHVATGAALYATATGQWRRACALTAVKFRFLAEEEIEAYVQTGHPLDKAGAYGIQELGSLLVEKIDGCYFNVVGLPLTVVRSLVQSVE